MCPIKVHLRLLEATVVVFVVVIDIFVVDVIVVLLIVVAHHTLFSCGQ